MTVLRILIADDHTLVRAGFRSLLENMPDCTVVAEVGDGHEVLRLVAQLQPDVVLMDVKMPTLNGLEATVRISRDYPSVRVVILSMYTNEEYVLQALRAGAVGYLLKDAATAELQLAIQAAVRGEMYLSPSISKRVLQDYIQLVGSGGGMLDALTSRQREVLQLIAEGRTMKEIALLLKISVKTAESHRTQLMERLDIHDVTGLVRFAIRAGLVTPE